MNDFINNNLDLINSGPLQLYGSPEYKTLIHLYGKGKFNLETGKGEMILMPQRGRAIVKCGSVYTLDPFDMCRVDKNESLELNVMDNCVVLTVKMIRH